MTYHPRIIVVAQGSKRVNLGRTSFTYDQSPFVVTVVDLPIVSWGCPGDRGVSLSRTVNQVRYVYGAGVAQL